MSVHECVPECVGRAGDLSEWGTGLEGGQAGPASQVNLPVHVDEGDEVAVRVRWGWFCCLGEGWLVCSLTD